LPADPLTCWKLTDKLLRADGKILGRVDDSDGSVGSVYAGLCLLWLQSADRLGKSKEHWLPLVREIYDSNDYGCRDSFMRNASLLLTSESLRGSV
jgi:hypothetical protein